MSKIEQYIKDAVNATRKDTVAAGCTITDVNIDSSMQVDIHADEAINTLNILAQAALESNKTIQVLSKAVTETMSVNNVSNNSQAISLTGIDTKPRFFEESHNVGTKTTKEDS